MNETVVNLPTQIHGVESETQVVILVLPVHRDGDDGPAHITAGQIDAALGNARATLEMIEGTDVAGTATALVVPQVALAAGESLTLSIEAALVKSNSVNEQD